LGIDLAVPGYLDLLPPRPPSPVATVDEYEITLATRGIADRFQTSLTFTVQKRGKPVTDLQPYLGALGHLVVLREGDLAYIHTHPERAPGTGPSIVFEAELPSAGLYGLFLQFAHEGRVRTADFRMERPF
jgi:hypothetical protein